MKKLSILILVCFSLTSCKFSKASKNVSSAEKVSKPDQERDNDQGRGKGDQDQIPLPNNETSSSTPSLEEKEKLVKKKIIKTKNLLTKLPKGSWSSSIVDQILPPEPKSPVDVWKETLSVKDKQVLIGLNVIQDLKLPLDKQLFPSKESEKQYKFVSKLERRLQKDTHISQKIENRKIMEVLLLTFKESLEKEDLIESELALSLIKELLKVQENLCKKELNDLGRNFFELFTGKNIFTGVGHTKETRKVLFNALSQNELFRNNDLLSKALLQFGMKQDLLNDFQF